MQDPISPELVLVDPDLAARARAALPEPALAPTRTRPPSGPTPSSAPAEPATRARSPLWARVTAALWLLVLGILIGGAAVPHAQDRPRVITPAEEAAERICQPAQTGTNPAPATGSPARPGP